ncbi:hypothetical protein RESH_00252 [Rhodopirellula europaea SH398]|uniref:Uncharacterized protein n=1 Tax=Rhodopirellula europaea SH398 TaxID=1263868 RepID=M5SS89_9BACT|nr:hypothetical protein RESH_00252 [Rhodopirellula europaea SH398]
MLFQEFDQILPRDPSILRSRNAVAFQTPRIEPFTNSSWGNFTDLGDLSSCEDLHTRCSKTPR